jgi:HPt (histidine-containing phosphotransfer) domain-containing protein
VHQRLPTPLTDQQGTQTLKVETASPAAILDVEGTLARLGGDTVLFVEMGCFLLEDAPPLFADLRNAALADDSEKVECKAHALKGLLINCGGVRAAHPAQLLEAAGRAGNLSNAANLLDSLDSELAILMDAIRSYRP